VRNLLAQTAKRLKGQTTWTPEFGWGRLDVGKAVAAAKVAGAPAPVATRRATVTARRLVTTESAAPAKPSSKKPALGNAAAKPAAKKRPSGRR